MKLQGGYVLRGIAGEHILMYEGPVRTDLRNAFSLNETAAWMWNRCSDVEFSREDMIDWLLAEYDVDREIAAADVDAIIAIWRDNRLVLE